MDSISDGSWYSNNAIQRYSRISALLILLSVQLFFSCFRFSGTESCDGIRRSSEMAMHSGYQRRTRDIADWARSKRRRYIRREDLLAYLAGKSPPPSSVKHVSKLPQHLYATAQTKQSHSPNHFVQYHPNQLTPHPAQPHADHHLHGGAAFMPTNDSDLHTFKEALARRPR